MPTLDLPPLDILTQKLTASSFKIFTDPNHYVKSYRAAAYPSWSSTSIDGCGSDVYRIFFNNHSKKIYIDLNAQRWAEARREIETERLYCEILKTLIFVLTCGIREEPNSVTTHVAAATALHYPNHAPFGSDEKTEVAIDPDETKMISVTQIKRPTRINKK